MPIIEQIIDIATRETGREAGWIKPETQLEQLFEDSLEWISFIQSLREEIGPLSDEKAQKAETIGELASAYIPG